MSVGVSHQDGFLLVFIDIEKLKTLFLSCIGFVIGGDDIFVLHFKGAGDIGICIDFFHEIVVEIIFQHILGKLGGHQHLIIECCVKDGVDPYFL